MAAPQEISRIHERVREIAERLELIEARLAKDVIDRAKAGG
ncbi:MAG: hypothetical protein ACRDL6_04575 [Solirubrobacterales bacterium]